MENTTWIRKKYYYNWWKKYYSKMWKILLEYEQNTTLKKYNTLACICLVAWKHKVEKP